MSPDTSPLASSNDPVWPTGEPKPFERPLVGPHLSDRTHGKEARFHTFLWIINRNTDQVRKGKIPAERKKIAKEFQELIS